jgi:hypothetical protein
MMRSAIARRPAGPRVAVAVAVALLIAAVGTASAIGPQPTRGRIPAEAFRADGSLNVSLVPDFIPALDRAGQEVGWVSIVDVGILGSSGLDEVPVYADDLKTVVGHMIAGRGFVPQGISRDSVPRYEVRKLAD